jgi:hypothetical protein
MPPRQLYQNVNHRSISTRKAVCLYLRRGLGTWFLSLVEQKGRGLRGQTRPLKMDKERRQQKVRHHALGMVEKVSAETPCSLSRFRVVEKALKNASSASLRTG